VLGTFSSCKKRLDTRVSLWRMDKIPYGTRYAYENLSAVFPHADIRTGNQFPVLFQSGTAEDTSRALIILSPLFAPEPDEMRSIIRFASSGNQVFISALHIDDTVMTMLHQKQTANLFFFQDSGEVSILDPIRNEWEKYTYPGYNFNNYFEPMDSGFTTVLGKNSQGQANFIRVAYEHGGSIFIHLNPFQFSNFFLLHNKNKSYYDLALSYIPGHTGVVEWSDYFRYRKHSKSFSTLNFILSKRSLRWAFWLTIVLCLLMFIVESKRKQRPIAEIPSLRNASEDFVKTVGRLYFQQKNNQNLFLKMVSAFLENVRSTYQLPTSQLNEEFAVKLAFRSGKPVEQIKQIMQAIFELKMKTELSDKELMDFNEAINQFNTPA
jgi:hypothetical protein